MNEIMDRIATGRFAAYKRHAYAKYWLGGGLVLAFYAAISAPFDKTAVANDMFSIMPFYLAIVIGYFLSPFARDFFGSDASVAKYDEFENAALNSAQAQAYWYILMAVLALTVWQWLGTSFDFPVPNRPYDWSAIFVAFLTAGIALPVFIAECTIPILPKNDVEAEGEV